MAQQKSQSKLLIACVQLVVFIIALNFTSTAHGEINRFYLGYRAGIAESVKIKVGGAEPDIDNAGAITSIYGGYNFSEAWSAELSLAYLADIDLIVVSGDDISLFTETLTANYTHKLGKSFFVRGHGGIERWELEAENNSSILGVDLEQGESISMDKSGTSIVYGASFGLNPLRTLEWTIIGLRGSYSDELKLGVGYMGLRLSF